MGCLGWAGHLSTTPGHCLDLTDNNLYPRLLLTGRRRTRRMLSINVPTALPAALIMCDINLPPECGERCHSWAEHNSVSSELSRYFMLARDLVICIQAKSKYRPTHSAITGTKAVIRPLLYQLCCFRIFLGIERYQELGVSMWYIFTALARPSW